MTDKHVWFITGRGRGRGVYIATAARAAGHTGVATVATGRTLHVVATGRSPQTGRAASDGADDLLEAR